MSTPQYLPKKLEVNWLISTPLSKLSLVGRLCSRLLVNASAIPRLKILRHVTGDD